MSAPNPDAVAERIRAELAATPGAMACTLCPTITQGGSKGLALHLTIVHGG